MSRALSSNDTHKSRARLRDGNTNVPRLEKNQSRRIRERRRGSLAFFHFSSSSFSQSPSKVVKDGFLENEEEAILRARTRVVTATLRDVVEIGRAAAARA